MGCMDLDLLDNKKYFKMGLNKRKFDIQREPEKVEGGLKDFMRKVAFDTEYVYEESSQIKCENRFYPNNTEYACAIYWLQVSKIELGNLFLHTVTREKKRYCYYSAKYVSFPGYHEALIEVITNYALDMGISTTSTCGHDSVSGGFEIRFDMSNLLIKLNKF